MDNLEFKIEHDDDVEDVLGKFKEALSYIGLYLFKVNPEEEANGYETYRIGYK